LAERDRKLLRDDAPHGIDAAAGRIRHDQSDAAVRIILRERLRTNNYRDRSSGRGPQ